MSERVPVSIVTARSVSFGRMELELFSMIPDVAGRPPIIVAMWQSICAIEAVAGEVDELA